MRYIEPHAHMVSRTTDDYRQMALSGCVAVSEPAFWAGFDRLSPDGFDAYFRQLTDFEPKRAAQYGIQHYTWLCLNPKEGEDRALGQKVLACIEKYLDRPNVVGIGEIGVNRVTQNELATFRDHVSFALERKQLILIHTPHLEDKYKGTRMIIDMLKNDPRVNPARVCIDHVEEHTVKLVLDGGFWAGMTLYPNSKCTPARAVDILDRFGSERLWMNSACDWGPSVPLNVPRTALEMRRRGWTAEAIDRVIFQNPVRFLSQCPKFKLPPA